MSITDFKCPVRFTGLKTCNIDYSSSNKNYLLTGGDVQTLGTSKPGTPNIAHVLDSGYFPTLTGNLFKNYGFVGKIGAGVENQSGVTRLVYYELELVKGSTHYTLVSGSVSLTSSNYRVGINFYQLTKNNSVVDAEPQEGDTINIYLWADGANVIMDRHYIQIGLSIISPANNVNKILKNVSISVTTNVPSNFSNVNTGDYYLYLLGNSILSLSGNISDIDGICEDNTGGLVLSRIDLEQGNYISASTSFRTNRFFVPTQIIWKESIGQLKI